MPWEYPRFADWIEEAERWAYGPLALTPQQFTALTPREFQMLCAGYEWRQERRWDEIAFHVWIVLVAAGAKNVTPSHFLGGRLFGDTRVPGYRVRG